MAEELREAEIDERIAILQTVPLFSGLREADWRPLAKLAESKTYRPGQELFHQSDVDGKLFVIRSGQVALYYVNPQGEERLVDYRAAIQIEGQAEYPTWMGEASVLLNDPHDVTAVAATEVSVLEIRHDRLMSTETGFRRRLTPSNPDNADRVRLAERKFKWLDKDEVVMRYVQQHAWNLTERMVIPVGALFVLILVAVLLNAAIGGLSIVIAILLALIPVAVGVVLFIDWRDDYYVVTNKRVLHLDQVPWGRQRTEEAPLGTIQEVQISRLSLMAQLLDFGDLRVETFAGSIAMQYVPQPDEVRKLIFLEKERVLSRSRASARKAIHKDLSSRLTKGEQVPPRAGEGRPASPTQEPTPPQPWWRYLFGYFFPKLREVEGDRITYRTHWISLVQRGKFPLLGLVSTVVGFIIWWNRGFIIGALPDAAWLVWPVLLVIFGAWSLWVFEDWRNDLYIVTSNRIIDIQRTPLLLRETRKEATLDRIQTLKTDVPSIWARYLRYGTVTIGVPGSAFEFKTVMNPTSVQSEISNRIEQFKRAQAQAAERGRRTELGDWFAVYDQIQKGYKPPGVVSAAGEQASDGTS
jgi:CRP-like cAMP-binding protein